MLCNNCGTQNQNDAKFCAGCGADLTSQSPVDSQQPMYGQQDYPQQTMYGQPDNQQPMYGQPDYPQQPMYGQPDYPQQPPMYPPVVEQDPGKGFAIASLVLGIVSLLCLPAVTGILGIIFGVIAKNKGSKSPMAIAGIICGVIGIALWVVMMILGVAVTDIF